MLAIERPQLVRGGGQTDVQTYGHMDGQTDIQTDVQIPPVFYRTLSPPVPSGAAAQKVKGKSSKVDFMYIIRYKSA